MPQIVILQTKFAKTRVNGDNRTWKFSFLGYVFPEMKLWGQKTHFQYLGTKIKDSVCSECYFSLTNEYPNIFALANLSQMNV